MDELEHYGSSTDLGTEPNQEFLILVLNPQSSFAAIHGFSIRVRNSGPKFIDLFMVRVRVRVILTYDVALVHAHWY